MSLLTDLKDRGLIHQETDADGLEKHLETPQTIYCGFDPTASSLTVGNLVPIMVLAHFQRAGHTPMVLMGGATGLIGDPSGKSAERPLLGAAAVTANMEAQRRIFQAVLSFDPALPNSAVIVNNAEWLSKPSFIEALRDIGKHFPVNQMLQRDSVRERLGREQGISYTEFSYMLLQAWDFKHLFEHAGVSVQLGGSDQWGNIVQGVDLVRRTCRKQVFGLTCPLVTRADGGKFGKTEAGPIWLSSDRTSPYALYQFFLNTSDTDVGRFLRLFTFLSLKEIEQLETRSQASTAERLAQRALAREATSIVHGGDAAREAELVSDALFSGDISHLSMSALEGIAGEIPTQRFTAGMLPVEGLAAVDFACVIGACTSKRDAREKLGSGSLTLNGRKLTASDVITRSSLLHGQVAVVRRGKKNWYMAIWA